jgi:hypothetical protein
MCDAVRVTTLEDSMDKWKTIAMVSMGFACGALWMTAGGGANSAQAGISGPSVVVTPHFSPTGRSCAAGELPVTDVGRSDLSPYEKGIVERCCTDLGGTMKGWHQSGNPALPICVY